MLIPTVIALSEFFSSNFPNISWYPYWYLGNLYHYLIGPVVPTLLAISNIKYQISNIYLGLILGSMVLGGFGLYLFLKDWGVSRKQAIFSGILYSVLPAGLFLLNYQNGLNHIGFGFLPFALLLFRKFLVKENKFLIVFLTLTITMMLLTSVSILLPLLIGFIALFVSMERKDGVDEKIGKTVLIILLSLLLSTLWYTPKFWWVTIANPSVGGVPLGKLVWSILQLLLQFLPIALAIFIVKLNRYKVQGYLFFGFLFFTSFLFLSIVRFLSDPDFVMDWIGFSLELQFGGAILLGNIKYQISNIKKTYQKLKIISIIIIFVFLLIIDFIIINTIFKDKKVNIYQNSIVSMLEKNVKENERVFLSGSSVFFINSKINVQQVRGGVDQSSINPIWAHGAYQVREGEDAKLSYNWLKAFGVSYVLVQDKYSEEPFHDFKHPEKFADFELINSERGNTLYGVQDSYISRVADKNILNVRKPKNGTDKQSINNYILSFKRPLIINSALQNQKPNEIRIEGDMQQDEVISLAVSYDNSWKIVNGKGVIREDSLGNMVIIPKNTGLQKFKLVYKRSLFDLVMTLGLSIVIAIILIKYQKIVPYIRKRLPKIHIGLREEEE